MAVALLLAIAAVLAWGTLYETRFGTAAVQRFVYHSWWFQSLLAFLAVNLSAAALERFPWKRKHVPFVLAHVGIVLILAGGVLGGRFGVEGQLVIPEGETSASLQLPANVLVVHQPNPGIRLEFKTRFESTAWNHSPHALFDIPLGERSIQLVVDRYYPNARRRQEITDEGKTDNPAIHLILSHEGEEDAVWLFARDPNRFEARWAEAHALFLQPESEREMKDLLKESGEIGRGIVALEFPDLGVRRRIPVPARLNKSLPIEGTPYRITFKDYFSDFALSEKGPVSRSDRPNNPAVAFALEGPEGTDAHLLFALHPDFAQAHGRRQKIHAHAAYSRSAEAPLPPDSIAILRMPSGRRAGSGRLVAVLTGRGGTRRRIDPLRVGQPYEHPTLGYRFEVSAFYPCASAEERFADRDNEVRAEALHFVAREGERTAGGWLGLRESVTLPWGDHPVVVEYRPAIRELPFAVRLLDFRKTNYPGTEMPAAFESDVQITDASRGITLRRTTRMTSPLKYRGFSLFQSSYIQDPVETTVLSVRSDPGTPLVYAGFLVVVAGVAAMFLRRKGPLR